MKDPTNPGSIVSMTELPDLLGVSRQRIDKLRDKDPSFPAPIDVLREGKMPLWLRSSIESYRSRRAEAATDEG